AAAVVAGQAGADLFAAGLGVVLEQVGGGDQHAGRAEAALQGVIAVEGLLQCSQCAAFGQAFDGLDLCSLSLHGIHEAGAYLIAVVADGAGAAGTLFAADVGPGQVQFLAQEVGQGQAWTDAAADALAVDGQVELVGGVAHALWSPLNAFSTRPRSTRAMWALASDEV